MFAFALVVAKYGNVIDPEVMLRIDQPDLPELIFEPDESIRWSNCSGSVFFRGWQAFAEIADLGSHWHVSSDGLTAFAGYVWPQSTGWAFPGPSWAHQLKEFLDCRDILSAHEELFGHYSIVRLSPDGTGVIATDILVCGLVFTGETANTFVISNRSSIVARAITSPGSLPARDVLGSGWPLFWGPVLGGDTCFQDVSHLPFGTYIEIDPLRGATTRSQQRSYWQFPEQAEIPSSFEELLPLLDAELRDTVRSIARLPVKEFEVRLSGGKDSRLVAALLVDEGFADRFTFVSYGTPGKSDVVVGRAVAEHLNLNWQFDDRSGPPPYSEHDKMRVHTFQVEGMISGWDLCGDLTVDNGITLTGVGGDFLKLASTQASVLPMTDQQQIIETLTSKAEFDPLRLLRKEARHYYSQLVADWCRQTMDTGVEPQRIGTMFFQQERPRSWTGPSRAVKTRVWPSPFFTPMCIRALHQLPARKRTGSRFHLDLMRQCNVELTKIPFAQDTWGEEAIRHLPDAGEYRGIQPVTADKNAASSWRMTQWDQHRPYFEEYLLDQSNPLFEVANFERVKDALLKRPMEPQRLRFLYAAVTAAIWLGRHERWDRISRRTTPMR